MKRLVSAIFAAVVCFNSLFGQEGVPAVSLNRPDTAGRPKVGLVLSGGGAKGMAHIGVFRMLEELDIPVDYIVGTSIGSIMGAMYSLGYSSSEICEVMENIDWDNLMQDNFSRRRTLYEDKKYGDQLLIKIPFWNRMTFRNAVVGRDGKYQPLKSKRGGVGDILNNLPNALVEGQNVQSLLTQLSVGYQDDIDFNDLPIPFACVAVDLNSKKEYVFHKGDLVTAIRASMSIPGYFSPVEKDGMFLVDGGMLNNFPVDVAREMGADIVIGSDLHKYTRGRVGKVENLGDMVSSTLAIMNGPKFDAGRKDSDILICPNTSDFGVLSFDEKSISALIERGYVAAQEVIGPLRELAGKQHSRGGHNIYSPGQPPVEGHAINITSDSVRVSQITIEGVDSKEASILMKGKLKNLGKYSNGREIDSEIEKMYLTRAFSKVNYSLVGGVKDSGYIFKIDLVPERIHQVGVGFRFDSEVMAEILLNMSLNRHRIYGWKVDMMGKLGANPYATVVGGYSFSPKWQLSGSYLFRHSDIQLHTIETDVRYASYDVYSNRAEIFAQNKGLVHDLRMGVRGDINSLTSIVVLPDGQEDISSVKPFREQYFSAFASLDVDNRDRSYFATRGVRLHLSAAYDIFGKNNDSNSVAGRLDFRFNVKGYVPAGRRVTIIPQLYARYLYNNPVLGPDYNLIGGYEEGRYVDGHLPFVGANNAYIMQDFVSIARLDCRVNIFRNHFVTAMANYLMSGTGPGEAVDSPGYSGVGLTYSVDTFLGPIGLTGHWSNLSNKFGVYFSLGYSF